jgi:hypothetical protein
LSPTKPIPYSFKSTSWSISTVNSFLTISTSHQLFFFWPTLGFTNCTVHKAYFL